MGCGRSISLEYYSPAPTQVQLAPSTVSNPQNPPSDPKSVSVPVQIAAPAPAKPIPTVRPELSVTELPEGTAQTGGLKDFNLVWFDPSVNSSANAGYHVKLKSMFTEAIFESDPAAALGKIDVSANPVVFVSSGERYEDIRATVESKHYVIAACIFCMDVGKYSTMYKGKPKIVDVTNDFSGLESALQKVHCDYVRFLRFFDNRTEKTFYTREDKDTIINSLKMMVENAAFSVFYPLGMKYVETDQRLNEAVLAKIDSVAKGDSKVSPHYKAIAGVIEYLRHNHRMEHVIKSYTQEKLYYMLNLYLRFGNPEGLELFKEYMFCLKGSMCEKGLPVIEKDKKLYRGLRLPAGFLEKYREQKGKIVLLNGFTSTTTDPETAMRFMNMGTNFAATLMELTLTDFDESFNSFIMEFGFPEENGVFFPVDIAKFSEYEGEKEVLFPPFYPIKILDIQTVAGDNGAPYNKIVISAPFCVNIAGTKVKDWRVTTDFDWKHVYLESMLELAEKGIIDKLSIDRLEIAKNPVIFQRLCDTIKHGAQFRHLLITNDELGPKLLTELMESLAEGTRAVKGENSLQHLSLSNDHLDAQALVALSTLMKEKGVAIKSLDLSDNPLWGGVDAFAEGIKDCKTLTNLVLKGCKINNTNGKAITTAVMTCPSLTVLDLSGNELGPEPGKAVGLKLRDHKSLSVLNLDFCGVGDETAKMLGLSLRENGSLQTLSLVYNKITEEGAKGLALGLKNNAKLSTLSLRKNAVSSEAGKALGAALNLNSTLTVLDLSECGIKDEAMIGLAAGLRENATLSVLRLNSNMIKDPGGKALADALVGGNKGLTELNLDFNYITVVGGKPLAQAVGRSTTLRDLNLHCSKVGEDPAWGVALRENKSLVSLNLCDTQTRGAGIAEIASALEGNTTLRRLNLYINHLRLEELKAVARMLCKNNTLQELNLGMNELRDEGCADMGVALSQNGGLLSLDLCGNYITAAGVRVLSEGVAKNKSLESLVLSSNALGDQGGKAVATVLIKGNSRLKTLDLSDCYIADLGAKELAAALSANANLTRLVLRGNKIGPGAKALFSGRAVL